MTRHEVECSSGEQSSRDARRVIVARGLIERASERAALIVADRRMVQPVDPMQRRQYRRHGPLVLGRVRDGDMRDLARRVVAREHAVPLASPPIVAAVVLRRQPGYN